MFGEVDKEPVGFEKIIFKWIFLPLVLIGLIYLFTGITKDRYKCKSVCEEKGYFDFRFQPSGRYGISPRKCYCYTEEEARLPMGQKKGIQVY
jgi:hypothetical protein